MHEINDGVFKTDINDNLYIVPDIHGDYQCIIHILVDLIKCCNITKVYEDIEFDVAGREYLEWNNSNSIVVFCGDMIHRKRFDNDNIYYHLKSNTQDFLHSMFHISIELEKLNEIRIQNEDKSVSSSPLR